VPEHALVCYAALLHSIKSHECGCSIALHHTSAAGNRVTLSKHLNIALHLRNRTDKGFNDLIVRALCRIMQHTQQPATT
jgi:hypothetical protein